MRRYTDSDLILAVHGRTGPRRYRVPVADTNGTVLDTIEVCADTALAARVIVFEYMCRIVGRDPDSFTTTKGASS